MSSVVCRQLSWGHLGLSTFPIVWRCLFTGACPVRSCVRMLVCLQLSVLVIFENSLEGSKGSMVLRCLYLGDFLHHLFVWTFICLLIACLIADMLVGSVLWRKVGSLSGVQ
jgi:hypothetical protein